MRLLLDTHTFIWLIGEPDRLSAKARRSLTDARNECFLSLTSTLEMAIKIEINKLRLPFALAEMPMILAKHQLNSLPIEHKHLVRLSKLPVHHGDPFDRLLAAQAIEENLSVVSHDQQFRRYDIGYVW